MEKLPKLPDEIITYEKNNKKLIFNPYTGGKVVVDGSGDKILNAINTYDNPETLIDEYSSLLRLNPYEVSARIIEFISKLNETGIFFKPKQTKNIPPPFFGFLEITRKCFYPCRNCTLNAGKPLPNEMSIDEMKKAIDKMSELGVKFITLTGGDPLTRNGFLELLTYIKQKSIGAGISTSLGCLTPDIAKEFQDLGVLMQVSLDGSTPEINDWNRGKDSFENAMKGIELLNKYDVRFRIAYCVMKHNVKDVEKMCDLAVKLHAEEIAFRKVKLMGRAKKIAAEIYPSIEDMVYVYAVLHNKSVELRNKIRMNVKYNNEFERGRENCELLSCSIGKYMMHIAADGRILPCSLLPSDQFSLGDIRKDDLKEIWYKSGFLNKFRNLKVEGIEECKNCKIKYICGGGCRAEPLSEYNDLMKGAGDCKDLRYYFKILFDETIAQTKPIGLGV